MIVTDGGLSVTGRAGTQQTVPPGLASMMTTERLGRLSCSLMLIIRHALYTPAQPLRAPSPGSVYPRRGSQCPREPPPFWPFLFLFLRTTLYVHLPHPLLRNSSPTTPAYGPRRHYPCTPHPEFHLHSRPPAHSHTPPPHSPSADRCRPRSRSSCSRSCARRRWRSCSWWWCGCSRCRWDGRTRCC